ncbi:hypothetical protein GCM10023176_47570 [Micromonospora coerulea]|uniref:Uncharacterized protein n=1 Tax=Micromonospora coerulea TaxID=47856 RepID=A0ABP8SYC0_9ACTN
MRQSALLASRSPPRCKRCLSVRPELAGDGCCSAESREGGFGVQPVGVVAGGDEQLPGGVDADAGQRDQVRSHGGDKSAQVAVEVIDLGLKGEPAAGRSCARPPSWRLPDRSPSLA